MGWEKTHQKKKAEGGEIRTGHSNPSPPVGGCRGAVFLPGCDLAHSLHPAGPQGLLPSLARADKAVLGQERSSG